MPNGMSEKPTSLVGCGVGGGTREGTLYPIGFVGSEGRSAAA